MNVITKPSATSSQPLDPGEGEILTLFERLHRAGWHVDARSEPLALALCALALRLNPLVEARRVAETLPMERTDFGLVDFENAIARLGWQGSSMAMRIDDLDPRLTPCVFLLGPDRDSDHPARPMIVWKRAAEEDGTCTTTIFDCETSDLLTDPHDLLTVRRRGTALVYQKIEPLALPTSAEARKLSGNGWFRSLLGRFRRPIRQMLVLGAFLNILALATPIAVLLIYSRVIGPRSVEPLLHIAAGAAVIVAAELTLRRARAAILTSIASRMDYVVGVEIFEKLLRLPARLASRASVSDQVARMKTFEAIRDAFCGPVMMSALDAPAAVVALIAIAVLAGDMVLVPIAAMIGYAVIFYLGWRQTRIRIREAAVESSVLQQFALETFQRLEDIQLDGLAGRWSEKFREILGRESVALLRLRRLGTMCELAGHGLMAFTSLTLLYAGAWKIWDGALSFGALMASMMLLWRALAPFHNLSSLVPRFEQIRNSIIQIDALMDIEDEETSERATVRAARLRGALEFANVTMRYDAGAPPVFSGLNASIAADEIIGIMGPSGSGKSTVLRLVLGVQPTLLGSVRFDGFDIRQLNPGELRGQISYLPQSVPVFSTTLAENVRIAAPLADDDQIAEALRRAGLDPDNDPGFPDGLAQEIDPASLNRVYPIAVCRIGLARALVRQTRVLALDEQPSDVLGAGFDEDFRATLARERGRRTIIFVSNRADFLRRADRVIALTPGAVPRIGSPDSILAGQ